MHGASVLVLVAGILVLVGVHIYLHFRVHLLLHKVATPLALASVLGIGFFASYAWDRSHLASEVSNQGVYHSCIVRVKSDPEQKAKSVAVKAEVLSIRKNGKDTLASGLANLYFQQGAKSAHLQYGDILFIGKSLDQILKSRNPHQFDFKQYYAYQNIYSSAYLKNEEWERVGVGFTNPIYILAFKVRSKLKGYFALYFKDDAIRGVAQAIVFGYKADLDDDWLDAFSKTGTIHVLAVSGLHVGIIFVLISSILFMKWSRGTSLRIKSGVVLLVLFGYCLLTGFAPSVSRASIMFGVVVIAKAWDRQSNIYNTLSFAGLILLVIDPYSLFNVGFQFSFLAVVGIVYYKDTFRKTLPQRTLFGDKVVTLLSVSIAAQITTFPLGLYYFHQYPNLFMISNLFVIPIITVILYGGIFFCVVAPWWDAGAQWLSEIVSFYISVISRAVYYIQDLPYAFFEGIHITYLQMIYIYLFIGALTVTFRLRRAIGFVLACLLVVLFIAEDYTYEHGLKQNEVISFDVGRDLLVGFRSENELVLIASKGFYLDENKMEFVVKPYLIKERLGSSCRVIPIETLKEKWDIGELKLLGNGVVWYQNQSYLINRYVPRNKTFSTDFLVTANGLFNKRESKMRLR